MLGKQWLNRYLRHTGGSIIERCGDRHRKFNGLERWPFRLFIESLPIMLQLALFLLACGLSRYMWSINTSVARVVISFTLLGFLFYIGIVIAGTWSYECPFQTPVSIALRDLKDSWTSRGLFVSLIRPILEKTQRLLVILSPPNTALPIYIAWMDFRQGLVSSSHRAYSIMRHPLTPEFSLSQILSGIRDAARKAGHWPIILLLKMDRKFRDAKLRMARAVRTFMRAGLLPTSNEDVNHEAVASHNGQGLRVPVRNLEAIRRQNTDNADCVCWILQNITDPEALDAAIRLAGTIRWFDGDSDHDPPLDVIVPIHEACFDSTQQLYPGMRDRAYFSARAIVQINMRARIRSHEHAPKDPINSVILRGDSSDLDLDHVLRMHRHNTRDLAIPLLTDKNTRAHSLWLSNLLVDLTRAGRIPMLRYYESDPSVASTNHRPTIANALVAWYLHLGGNAEEETCWAVDKSYAVLSSFLALELLTPHTQPLIGNHSLPLVSKGDEAYC